LNVGDHAGKRYGHGYGQIKNIRKVHFNGSLEIGLKPSLPAFIICHGLKAVAIENQSHEGFSQKIYRTIVT